MKRKTEHFFKRWKISVLAVFAFLMVAGFFLSGKDTLLAASDPYYITQKTIVIVNGSGAAFDVEIREDGGDRTWHYSHLGKYVPKGTLIYRNPKSKYTPTHIVELDGLTMCDFGNNKHIDFYCDTSGTTPYILLGKSSKPGYTLTGVDVTGNGNAGTTTVSNGNKVVNFEDTTVDTSLDNFVVYAGATSNVSQLTCTWSPNPYELYLNPRSRDGVQGYLHGSDGNGTSCNNVTAETLITCKGTKLVYGFSNWSYVNYRASKEGYEFLGWEDWQGTLVYDANGNCIRGTSYFDANGNYCHADNMKLFARYKAVSHSISTYFLYQNADGTYPPEGTQTSLWFTQTKPHGSYYDYWGYGTSAGPDNAWWCPVHVYGYLNKDSNIYVKVPRVQYTLSLAKGTGISSVNGAGSYRWGQSVSAYASVGSGYTWNGWSGTYSSKNNPYIFNMPVKNVSLTANAKNNPPTGVKLSAKNGTTTLATATQTSAASVSGWQNSSIGLALDAYDPGDGLKRMEVFRNDTGASVFARDYSAAKSTTTLNGTDNIEGTVTFHGVATDMAGQTTQTKDLTVKIDTKAPVVSTFDVTLGTYKNPVKTPLQRPDGYINTEGYGAKINIIARDTNGKAAKGSGDVSNIRHAYIEVSDPTGTNPSRIYTLLEDGSDKSTFVDTRIINVIRDFPYSIDLDYTLHVVDNASNEFVQTKSTHREMEVYVTVERLTENGNTTNLTSNQFRGGYEGVVHIVTTGWVDTVSLAWPQDILDAGVIDGQFGLPVMDYNVTVDMNPENNPDILLRDDDGGSFTRCYDFPFWIPVYMEQVTGELDDETVIPYNITGTGTRGEDIKQTQAPFFLGGGSVLNDIRSVIIR